MARQYTPFSAKDLLNYTISLYYQMLKENNNIRINHKKHFEETEKVERRYHKLLKANNWETEETEPLFRKQLDFLTGVYTQEEKVQQLKQNKQKFKQIAMQ